MSDDVYSKLKELRLTETDPREDLRQRLLTLAEKNKKRSDLEVYQDLTKTDPELAAIAMIESSGGQNYKHNLDPNSGMTAGGMFGMMPFTASDVVRLDKDIAGKYPEIVQYTKDLPKEHAKITEFFNSNPEAAVEFAKSHYKRAKDRLGDSDTAAYSWYRGITNALRDRKDPNKIQSHDYVQKFKKYYKPTKVAKE